MDILRRDTSGLDAPRGDRVCSHLVPTRVPTQVFPSAPIRVTVFADSDGKRGQSSRSRTRPARVRRARHHLHGRSGPNARVSVESRESVPRDRGRAPAPATTPSVRVNPSHLTRAYRCARQRTNRLERGGNRSDARRRACALVARLKDPGRTRPAGHDTRRAADAELTVASDVRFGVGNDGLNWPHRDGLNWPHLRPIVA